MTTTLLLLGWALVVGGIVAAIGALPRDGE